MRRLICFCYYLLFILSTSVFGQNTSNNHSIISVSIKKSDIQYKTNRKLLKIEKQKYNPILLSASGLMYLYQNIISQHISANCTYQISCSEYTKKCIEKFGLIKGTLIGIHQLSCCQKIILKEVPYYRISNSEKIINTID